MEAIERPKVTLGFGMRHAMLEGGHRQCREVSVMLGFFDFLGQVPLKN
jgi:hypothetical protein